MNTTPLAVSPTSAMTLRSRRNGSRPGSEPPVRERLSAGDPPSRSDHGGPAPRLPDRPLRVAGRGPGDRRSLVTRLAATDAGVVLGRPALPAAARDAERDARAHGGDRRRTRPGPAAHQRSPARPRNAAARDRLAIRAVDASPVRRADVAAPGGPLDRAHDPDRLPHRPRDLAVRARELPAPGWLNEPACRGVEAGDRDRLDRVIRRVVIEERRMDRDPSQLDRGR